MAGTWDHLKVTQKVQVSMGGRCGTCELKVKKALPSESSASRSVVSNSVTHGLWPTRLFCPWNSLGKNTGVGCHSLSRESSWPRNQTQVSCIADGFFTVWATREALQNQGSSLNRHQMAVLHSKFQHSSIPLPPFESPSPNQAKSSGDVFLVKCLWRIPQHLSTLGWPIWNCDVCGLKTVHCQQLQPNWKLSINTFPWAPHFTMTSSTRKYWNHSTLPSGHL